MRKICSISYGFIALVMLVTAYIGVATAEETWIGDNTLRVINDDWISTNDKYTIDYIFNFDNRTVHVIHNLDAYHTTEDKIKLFGLDLLRYKLNTKTYILDYELGYEITEIDVIVTDNYTQFQFNQKSGGPVEIYKVNLISGEKEKQEITLAEVERLFSGPCLCASDYYDCSDFENWPAQQTCFKYCETQLPGGDVHKLDDKKTGSACPTAKSPIPGQTLARLSQR